MRAHMVLLACVAFVGVAGAHPKAAVKPMPTTPACVAPDASSPRFVTANGMTTICLTDTSDTPVETCFAFSPTAAPKVLPVAPKAVKVKAATVKRVAGGWSVCVGGTCRPVGKKLAKALTAAAAEARENNAPQTFTASASADRQVVVFGSAMWAVARDKALSLEPPKEYGEGGDTVDKPALLSVELIGPAIIASWYNCAGPCGQSVLVDGKGANRGTWFGAGVAFSLDAKRLGVFSIEAGFEFVVIDVASASQTSRLSIDVQDVTRAGAAKVDDRTAIVAFATEEGWMLRFVAAPAGTPVTAGATYTIPTCPR